MVVLLLQPQNPIRTTNFAFFLEVLFNFLSKQLNSLKHRLP